MPELLVVCARAFLVGGLICLAGQLLFDLANLTPAVSMSILVCLGSILGGFGVYEKLADWAGFGARLPIVSFGNTLVQGALEGARQYGFIGIFTSMLEPVSTGIVITIVTSFVIAQLFKPKA